MNGARSWRDDFLRTGTKRDSRRGMHFKASGKATALVINTAVDGRTGVCLSLELAP